MSGSKAQIINGFVLLLTFFAVRILYGFYKSYIFWRMYLCIYCSYLCLYLLIFMLTGLSLTLGNLRLLILPYYYLLLLLFTFLINRACAVDMSSLYQNPQTDKLYSFMSILYGLANIILNMLNIYWFVMMIRSVTSRKKIKDAQKKND